MANAYNSGMLAQKLSKFDDILSLGGMHPCTPCTPSDYASDEMKRRLGVRQMRRECTQTTVHINSVWHRRGRDSGNTPARVRYFRSAFVCVSGIDETESLYTRNCADVLYFLPRARRACVPRLHFAVQSLAVFTYTSISEYFL